MERPLGRAGWSWASCHREVTDERAGEVTRSRASRQPRLRQPFGGGILGFHAVHIDKLGHFRDLSLGEVHLLKRGIGFGPFDLHPGRAAGLHFLGLDMGRKPDNWHVCGARCREGTDEARGLDTGDSRQVDIHQHGVEVATGQPRNSIFARFGKDADMPQHMQKGPCHLLIDGVILDHQHFQRPRRATGAGASTGSGTAFARWNGTVSVKAASIPGRFSALSTPPSIPACRREIERPSPVPP